MAIVRIEQFCGCEPRVTGAILADGMATVAKYAAFANEAAEFAKNISGMLADGRIDNMERDTLKKMMEPLFAKVMELV